MSLAMLFFALLGCSKDKTNYEAELAEIVNDDVVFKEVIKITKGAYSIHIEALNGSFYKGYNEIRLIVMNARGELIKPTSFQFLVSYVSSNAILFYAPQAENLVFDSKENKYGGYVVFTAESRENKEWNLQFNLELDGILHEFNQVVQVKEQLNKNLNMTSFLANDGEEYLLALIAPIKPKVSENPLIAGIYKLNKATAGSLSNYSRVNDFTLRLDPRMPEPSMGNHSSLNNKDLIQQTDGFYHGVVNYTMTGNWTLNFILENQDGKIIKGTVVPTDFTPGVQGVKSELFIDILF